jgi:hypothetical protein
MLIVRCRVDHFRCAPLFRVGGRSRQCPAGDRAAIKRSSLPAPTLSTHTALHLRMRGACNFEARRQHVSGRNFAAMYLHWPEIRVHKSGTFVDTLEVAGREAGATMRASLLCAAGALAGAVAGSAATYLWLEAREGRSPSSAAAAASSPGAAPTPSGFVRVEE